MNKDARAMRDRFNECSVRRDKIPYTRALNLIREYGLEKALELAEACSNSPRELEFYDGSVRRDYPEKTPDE